MSISTQVQIESKAARALAKWENFFASEVRLEARRLAKLDGHPELITMADYTRAASISLEKLAKEIKSSTPDGKQKVA